MKFLERIVIVSSFSFVAKKKRKKEKKGVWQIETIRYTALRTLQPRSAVDSKRDFYCPEETRCAS